MPERNVSHFLLSCQHQAITAKLHMRKGKLAEEAMDFIVSDVLYVGTVSGNEHLKKFHSFTTVASAAQEKVMRIVGRASELRTAELSCPSLLCIAKQVEPVIFRILDLTVLLLGEQTIFVAASWHSLKMHH